MVNNEKTNRNKTETEEEEERRRGGRTREEQTIDDGFDRESEIVASDGQSEVTTSGTTRNKAEGNE
jgi:hypothetical protein